MRCFSLSCLPLPSSLRSKPQAPLPLISIDEFLYPCRHPSARLRGLFVASREPVLPTKRTSVPSFGLSWLVFAPSGSPRPFPPRLMVYLGSLFCYMLAQAVLALVPLWARLCLALISLGGEAQSEASKSDVNRSAVLYTPPVSHLSNPPPFELCARPPLPRWPLDPVLFLHGAAYLPTR
jgi:hypothetical protein